MGYKSDINRKYSEMTGDITIIIIIDYIIVV